MTPPPPPTTPPLSTPSFGLLGRQPLSPGSILLAFVAVAAALYSTLYATTRISHAHRTSGGSDSARSAGGASAASSAADEDDDPSQIDTIVLGDPADAPVPGRRGNHVSPVHATIVVRLPRFGDQVGLIPNTPAGQLLYRWLAAFNQSSYPALSDALPNVAPGSAVVAQMVLRQQTGGFKLISAKEAEPGILVFRLQDQTPSATEVLGTLQLRPDSSPAAIASFSLRAVPSSQQDSPSGSTAQSAASPR